MRNVITDMRMAFRKDKTVLKQSQFMDTEFSALLVNIFSHLKNKYRYWGKKKL